MIGGELRGERVSGKVVSGGADCPTVRKGDAAPLDVRVEFETDDGVVIVMKGLGLRHRSPVIANPQATEAPRNTDSQYFRQAMVFEAPKGKYEWLNTLIAVGDGRRGADYVAIDAHEYL